jgi:hypothetical protein
VPFSPPVRTVTVAQRELALTTTSDWQTSLGSVKRFIRFGVVAGQGAAGSLQQGLVTLVLDLESRS